MKITDRTPKTEREKEIFYIQTNEKLKLSDLTLRDVDLHVSNIVDDTDTDDVTPQHITNKKAKVYGDHVRNIDGNPHGTDHSYLENVYQADDTLSDTTTQKHVTNAQVKTYGDHVRDIDGNPHGTDHGYLENVLQSDDTLTDSDLEKHVTNAQVKKYEDHRLLLSDDTDTDNTTPANVTNAQVKVYGDHVRITTGNPHGTTWDLLSGEASWIPFDITPTGVPTGTGIVSWNSVDGTFDFQLVNGTTLQIGQETHFYGKASGNIANGELCQFAGVQGDHITFKKAVAAEVIANPHYLIGIATQNITNGNFGYITNFGKINGVYTKTPANNDSADWVAGDILYFDNTTGQMTKTAPDAPNIRIIVAAVIKEQTGTSENGILIVRPSFGIKYQDCDDVDGSATESGQFYLWDHTNKYFKPTSNIIIDDTNTKIYSDSNGGTAKDLTIACGSQKTVFLETPVWDDIIIPLVARAGAGNPTFGAFNAAGNLLTYRFSPTTVEQLYGSFEMPHTYKQESVLDFHVHWTPTTTGGGDVVWALEYTIVNIDGTYPANATLTATCAAGTTAWKHLYHDIDVIPSTGINLGAVCVFRLYRNATAGADTYAGDAALVSLGVHIQHDTLGSRQEMVK